VPLSMMDLLCLGGVMSILILLGGSKQFEVEAPGTEPRGKVV
jgi:hypothetical protein